MTLRAGIAGLGTVGAGVAKVLRNKGRALTLDETHHRGADRAETGETHIQRGNHGASAI